MSHKKQKNDSLSFANIYVCMIRTSKYDNVDLGQSYRAIIKLSYRPFNLMWGAIKLSYRQ